jgi:hypothetical protein
MTSRAHDPTRLRSLVRRYMPGLLLLTGLQTMGCGGDEAEAFQLVVTIDRNDLLSDGSDSATVLVSVLNERFQPPPQGASVRLLAVPTDAVTGDPPGNLNGTGGPVANVPTDVLGFAQFRLSCTDTSTLALQASYEGRTGRLAGVINCRPAPSGNWNLTISAEPRRIQANGVTTISVAATDESNRPVPEGTSVDLEVTTGDARFVRGAAATQTSQTDGSGRLTAQVRASANEGTSTVCARFSNSRFGSSPQCVSVVVNNRPRTDASCTATLPSGRAPADGQTVTPISFSVSDRDGNPVSAAPIDVTTGSGTFVSTSSGGDELGSTLALDANQNGDASAFLRSPNDGSSAELRAVATIVEDGVERQLTCEFNENLVFFGAPSCLFEGMQPGIIGVTNSGLPETGTVTFCFEGSRGEPVAAGLRVDFSFEISVSGLRTNAQSALTDNEGCASVEVTAGRQAGLFEMRATLPFGTSSSTCTSRALPIRHSRPSANGWNLRCEPETTNALVDLVGDEIRTSCPLTCSGFLRDRFGNPVNSGDVNVYFAAEQGIISSPVTPNADGFFTTTYIPNGSRPRDVPPLDTEPRLIDAATGAVINPRDMLVTIVAWTNGEEGFNDTNGDGFYNSGEVFIDLAEPFLDNDDNDEFNPAFPITDRFIDVETPQRPFNNRWDDGNRQWDANTVIWTRASVVLTSPPVWGNIADAGLVVDPTVPSNLSPAAFSQFLVVGTTITAVNPGAVVNLTAQTSGIGVRLRDRFLNAPAPRFTTINFGIGTCAGITLGTVPAALPGLGLGFSYERFLLNFDTAGNQVENDGVAFRRFEGRFDFDGDSITQRSSLLDGVQVVTSLSNTGASGLRCTFSATTTSPPTSACNDRERIIERSIVVRNP